MSKERLEEINNFSSLPLKKRISLTKESIKKELKANDYHMPKNININTQYLLEIIEQAERVQELEQELHFCQVTKLPMDSVEKYTDDLKKQNKRYREALEEMTIYAENLQKEISILKNRKYGS